MNSCVQRIRVPSGTGVNDQSMCMYSNGPVSIRWADVVWASGSAVRSETQLQTWPSCSGSGCVVSRKRTVLPRRSRIVASAYSVNSSGQRSMSFIACQTSSSGAAMTIALSVRAMADHHRRRQAGR